MKLARPSISPVPAVAITPEVWAMVRSSVAITVAIVRTMIVAIAIVRVMVVAIVGTIVVVPRIIAISIVWAMIEAVGIVRPIIRRVAITVVRTVVVATVLKWSRLRPTYRNFQS